MSTQYRLVQSGKTASGGCSAGQGSSVLLRTSNTQNFETKNTAICIEKALLISNGT
jgi:hypothetical protein